MARVRNDAGTALGKPYSSYLNIAWDAELVHLISKVYLLGFRASLFTYGNKKNKLQACIVNIFQEALFWV